MRIAYLDCFSGAAGDMFLGALVDAGVPRAVLEDAAAALQIGASLQFETVDRSGISATKVHVLEGGLLADAPGNEQLLPQQVAEESLTKHAQTQHWHGSGHAHPHGSGDAVGPAVEPEQEEQPHAHGRSLSEIRGMIQDSALAAEVKTLAIRAFDLLGHSEAKIHNVNLDEVHFHEVGAVDAIVDIVAAAAGLVHLRVDAWHCSPINVGGGTVRCAHGIFPVPAPATADLLRGAPTYSAHLQKELVTPTGAALLRALEPGFGPQPAMAVEQIGYGAGTRNPAGFPNVLRLSIGDAHCAGAQPIATGSPDPRSSALGNGAVQTVSVLEVALDDATPQLLAYVTELVLRQGALDVMLSPVTMKKGRAGTMLTLLAEPEDTGKFEQMLLRETTTLGLRVRQDRRVCLQRSHLVVQTAFGPIRVKIGSAGGETLNAHPEFEDCRKAAAESGIPLKRVQAAAVAAYLSQQAEPAKL